MTPEAKVKKKVVTQLKLMKAYYFYPVTGGYGRSGVPDIVGCFGGNFFWIECKAGSNEPTPLQQKYLEDIEKQGGIALIVNEENMHDIGKLLSSLSQRNPTGEKNTEGRFLRS